MNPIGVALLVAMAATVVVLLTGVVGFLKGGEFNRKYGNKLMRARVGLQLLAVILLGLLFLTQS
ncbi:MAG: twin transmembrane helix small protein [Geminicoccaceae bacterium]